MGAVAEVSEIYVGVGSNVDRDRNIRLSADILGQRFGALKLSTVYESTAVGFEGDDFYNLVVGFNSAIAPLALAEMLREIEYAHGRERGLARYAPRTLDLDLLLYGDLIIAEPTLVIPRSDVTEYAFVLGPLAEIAPHVKHPRLQVCYADLWRDFSHQPDEIRPLEFNWKGVI